MPDIEWLTENYQVAYSALMSAQDAYDKAQQAYTEAGRTLTRATMSYTVAEQDLLSALKGDVNGSN